MDSPHIPFNKSSVIGREFELIRSTLELGQIAGDQTFSKKCQTLIERNIGVPRALLTTSCTHALEMASLLLDIGPDDEVIVPSFTFVSTANAFVVNGATPVFADIRPDTFNLDETKLEELITARTKAIIPVHYGGISCEMDAILAIAQRHGIAIVEDNAHGLFGSYKGRRLGTLGSLATQSFHETKNITCGEGGALLINDPAFIERAEIIREKGTNRKQFFRGNVDKYTWVDIGSSYVMSDVLAAFLFGQLEAWESIQAKRKKLWERYDHGLAVWAEQNNVRRPIIPDECDQAYHLYYLLLPSLEKRDALMSYLRKRNILAVFHYLPLHSSPMGKLLGGNHFSCPVTEDISGRLLRLPFYNSMTNKEQNYVIEQITSFRCD